MWLVSKVSLHKNAAYLKFLIWLIFAQIVFIHTLKPFVLKTSLHDSFTLVANCNYSFHLLLARIMSFSHTCLNLKKLMMTILDIHIYCCHIHTTHSWECKWSNSIFFIFSRFTWFWLYYKIKEKRQKNHNTEEFLSCKLIIIIRNNWLKKINVSLYF